MILHKELGPPVKPEGNEREERKEGRKEGRTKGKKEREEKEVKMVSPPKWIYKPNHFGV